MTEAPERYVGGGVPRKEDPALVTGRAHWTDNIKLPGMLHMALLRSPFAHARITHLDVSGALEQPGVVAAFTGEDLADEWPGGVPCGAQVTDDMAMPFHPPLARDEVKYTGDAVAVVVATDRYRAQDALEFVEVDYEPLDVVTNMEAALEEGSPLVHEDLGTNECFTFPVAVGDIDDAFNRADVVVKERYIQQRLIPNAIEPRATVAMQDPGHDGYVVYSATQIPHLTKIVLSLRSQTAMSKMPMPAATGAACLTRLRIASRLASPRSRGSTSRSCWMILRRGCSSSSAAPSADGSASDAAGSSSASPPMISLSRHSAN